MISIDTVCAVYEFEIVVQCTREDTIDGSNNMFLRYRCPKSASIIIFDDPKKSLSSFNGHDTYDSNDQSPLLAGKKKKTK